VPRKRPSARPRAASKPTVDELLSTRERMDRVSAEFLRIDLETARTFLKIARETRDDLRKERNCLAARQAYETVARLSAKIRMSSTERLTVTKGLDQVKFELEQLGEIF
jgi:hypothetical protein